MECVKLKVMTLASCYMSCKFETSTGVERKSINPNFGAFQKKKKSGQSYCIFPWLQQFSVDLDYFMIWTHVRSIIHLFCFTWLVTLYS